MKLKHLMEEPTSCKEALQATELTGYQKYLNDWLSYCIKNIHLKYICKLDVNICNCLEKHSTFYNFWELSSIQSSIQLTNNSLECPRSKQCFQNTWTSKSESSIQRQKSGQTCQTLPWCPHKRFRAWQTTSRSQGIAYIGCIRRPHSVCCFCCRLPWKRKTSIRTQCILISWFINYFIMLLYVNESSKLEQADHFN